jgi:hypothetical protein
MRIQKAVGYLGVVGLFALITASGCSAAAPDGVGGAENAGQGTGPDEIATASSEVLSCQPNFSNYSFIPKDCDPWQNTGCTECFATSQCGDMDDLPQDRYGLRMLQTRKCWEVRPWGQSCTYNAECTLPDEFRRVWHACGC